MIYIVYNNAEAVEYDAYTGWTDTEWIAIQYASQYKLTIMSFDTNDIKEAHKMFCTLIRETAIETFNSNNMLSTSDIIIKNWSGMTKPFIYTSQQLTLLYEIPQSILTEWLDKFASSITGIKTIIPFIKDSCIREKVSYMINYIIAKYVSRIIVVDNYDINDMGDFIDKVGIKKRCNANYVDLYDIINYDTMEMYCLYSMLSKGYY